MGHRAEEFIIEAREHLTAVEESLLAWEKEANPATANEYFERCYRAVHSIKGDAGVLGFSTIRDLAHAMESCLSDVAIPTDPKTIEQLLAARDRLAVLVDDPRGSQQADISDVLQRLENRESSTEAFEIDLESLSAKSAGGLVAAIRAALANSTVNNPQLQFASCDLRNGLPKGPFVWSGRIAKSSTAKSRQRHSFTVNLDAVSAQVRGLVNYFLDIAKVDSHVSGQLRWVPRDLHDGLIEEPVYWAGEIHSELQASELTRQFDFEIASSPSAKSSLANVGSKAVDTSTLNQSIAAKTPTSTTEVETPGLAPAVARFEGDKATTLRMQVELLDQLMTLIGELTLVRNQSLIAFAEETGRRHSIIQRLSSVTTELQSITLRSRMQPVGTLFNKFPRMVRDLARQLGKKIDLQLKGTEVALDKKILEQLSDPLMHLVRNSVDHGIESPDERSARGKPATGTITLTAAHAEGQVLVRIQDDGRGIDPGKVKAKASSLGVKSSDELNRMTHRELVSLILLPGFSTAREVTDISGRGVGMDVVKTNIEHLEGSLQIESEPGQGCTTTLQLPLTLAIIPCLIVTVDGVRFAVPQKDLEEVVCLHPNLPGRVEPAFDMEVYRLRDKLLPVIRFKEVLHRKQPFTPSIKSEIIAAHSQPNQTGDAEYILVLRIAGNRYGLLIDSVYGTEEIVVKPLHPSLKRVGIAAGATILGDGGVALIIDAQGIVEHSRLSFQTVNRPDSGAFEVRDAAQVHRVLLFEYGPLERFAIPLVQIKRVETVSADQIEHVGELEFITVDGVSTRVLRLDKILNVSSPESDPAMMFFVLPKFVANPIGILVNTIVDTESLALDLQQHAEQQEGVLGTAIVRDRLTLFLETHRLSQQILGNGSGINSPSPLRGRGIKGEGAISHGAPHLKRILLIDDTAFFREAVRRYLSSDTVQIVTAVHGEDGLSQLYSSGPFDLIVSDIEMPVMDGWKFAIEVRRRGITTPLLALTSLNGPDYETRAKQCGYDGYEVKLDHDRLVKKVNQLLFRSESPAEGVHA